MPSFPRTDGPTPRACCNPSLWRRLKSQSAPFRRVKRHPRGEAPWCVTTNCAAISCAFPGGRSFSGTRLFPLRGKCGSRFWFRWQHRSTPPNHAVSQRGTRIRAHDDNSAQVHRCFVLLALSRNLWDGLDLLNPAAFFRSRSSSSPIANSTCGW